MLRVDIKTTFVAYVSFVDVMYLPGAGNLMMSGAASGGQGGRASNGEGSPGMTSLSLLVSRSFGWSGTCCTKATEFVRDPQSVGLSHS